MNLRDRAIRIVNIIESEFDVFVFSVAHYKAIDKVLKELLEMEKEAQP